MKKYTLLALTMVLLVGCATAPNLNSISLGMSKQEVIKSLGNPYSVSAKNNTEYLKYNCIGGAFLMTTAECDPRIGNGEYFVRLVNGKVESYGKVGDFDSAKNPAVDINANVKSEQK